MSSWLLFTVLCGIILVVAIAIGYIKNKDATKKLLKSDDKKDKSIKAGWWLFLAFGIVIAIVSAIFTNDAEAQEIKETKYYDEALIQKVTGPTKKVKRSGSWFNHADVYLGIDYTTKPSPMCVPQGIDDRVTSNGGIDLNVYRSYDSRLRLNVHYLHHSCALNSDFWRYDALGVSVKYRFWMR